MDPLEALDTVGVDAQGEALLRFKPGEGDALLKFKTGWAKILPIGIVSSLGIFSSVFITMDLLVALNSLTFAGLEGPGLLFVP